MIIESILYALGLFGFLWFHWFWVKVFRKSEKYDRPTRYTMAGFGFVISAATIAALVPFLTNAPVVQGMAVVWYIAYVIFPLICLYAFLGFCGLVRMARGVKV